MSSRFSDALTCLGCLILLKIISFVIYFMFWMVKIYGPLLLLVLILIYVPYAIIKSMTEK